jgi:hypothetical protein
MEDCHAVESKERRSQIGSDAAHACLVCSLGRGNQRPQDAFGMLAAARQGAADRRVVQRLLPKWLDSRRRRALRLIPAAVWRIWFEASLKSLHRFWEVLSLPGISPSNGAA